MGIWLKLLGSVSIKSFLLLTFLHVINEQIRSTTLIKGLETLIIGRGLCSFQRKHFIASFMELTQDHQLFHFGQVLGTVSAGHIFTYFKRYLSAALLPRDLLTLVVTMTFRHISLLMTTIVTCVYLYHGHGVGSGVCITRKLPRIQKPHHTDTSSQSISAQPSFRCTNTFPQENCQKRARKV